MKNNVKINEAKQNSQNTEKDQAIASKNNLFFDDTVKDFFLKTIEKEDWEKLFSWGNENLFLNGTDGYIKYNPYDFLVTKELNSTLLENNFFDFLINILNIKASFKILEDFEVWYYFVSDNNESFIICDNGDFEPLVYFKLPYFQKLNFNAFKIYFENGVYYLPNQR